MNHNPYFAPLLMNRRYTKTATFLVPLLGVPKKAFFSPELNGRSVPFRLLHNAYLQINNETTVAEGVIYLVLDGSEPCLLQDLLRRIKKANYSQYHKMKGHYHILAARVKPEFIQDYNLILAGHYSSISVSGRKAIIQSNLFDDGPIRLGQILARSPRLRRAWEKELKTNLGMQEVWPILELENETLNLDSIDTKMTSVRKKNCQYELNFEGQENLQTI